MLRQYINIVLTLLYIYIASMTRVSPLESVLCFPLFVALPYQNCSCYLFKCIQSSNKLQSIRDRQHFLSCVSGWPVLAQRRAKATIGETEGSKTKKRGAYAPAATVPSRGKSCRQLNPSRTVEGSALEKDSVTNSESTVYTTTISSHTISSTPTTDQ